MFSIAGVFQISSAGVAIKPNPYSLLLDTRHGRPRSDQSGRTLPGKVTEVRHRNQRRHSPSPCTPRPDEPSVPQGKWSTVPAVGIYPFDAELAPLSATCQRQNRVLVVDVGASQGGTMKEIRQTFPRPTGRIITQDLVPRRRPRPGGSPAPPELDIHPTVHDFRTAAAGEERVRFIT